MSDFTYAKPDPSEYLNALRIVLKKKEENDLLDVLRNASCDICDSSTFSRKRWNGLYTTIIIKVPPNIYAEVDEDMEQRLRPYCDQIMPSDTGLDVMNVEFTPLLGVTGEVFEPESDIRRTLEAVENIGTTFSIPEDLTSKGKEMTEAYYYLYIVENSLRIFIEKLAIHEYGDDFCSRLQIPNDVQKSMNLRKRQESKHAWISLRGNSELFYLDFKDLGTLILNNWELFKNVFPSQSWISTKIDEMGECRNLVAHNSYISEHERDLIRVNFKSIIKQIMKSCQDRNIFEQ